nr:hypothetical protein [Deltaproteobacteria bacterium]
MKLWHVLLAAMFVLLSAATVSGAEEVKKTGLVKGVITLEGLPTSEVVVSIEGLPAEYIRTHGSKTESRVMDQRLLNFVPKVLPIVVGTSVSFPNSDNTWHNVFSKSRAKEFDVGLYPPGESRSVMFDRPGVVRVLCNVHPTMEAHIVVKEHPF